jgi:glycosyltransferase involved in cell wall biosynthesis
MVTVVGNGIDLNVFQFDPVGRERARDELGAEPHDVLVGAVGRRVAEKGIFEFAEAARQLEEEAKFVLVGPQDPDKRDAVECALSGVTFLGECLDMSAVYSAVDVFVLPSYREGLPRSAMEAAACGRAIVLTDIRCSREIGQPGKETIFVPARQPSALTEAIRGLVADPSRRMGRAPAARGQRCFDQRSVAMTSFAVCRAVMSGKGLLWIDPLMAVE